MTPDQRKALELARDRMKRGEGSYLICIQLEQIQDDFPKLRQACIQLRKYIRARLTPRYGTLFAWQMSKGINHSYAERCIDRINWISWMLGELE